MGDNNREELPKSHSMEVLGGTNTTPKNRSHNPEVDEITTILFGPSMIQQLIDCLRTSVTNAISEAVSSLPLLGSTSSSAFATAAADDETTTSSTNSSSSGYHKLFRRLQLAYVSNLDRFVVYARRNLFSIPASKGYSAMQIISIFHLLSPDGNDDPSSSKLKNKTGGATIAGREATTVSSSPTVETPQQLMIVPRLEQIPSNDQQQALEDELERIRSNLRTMRKHGELLRSRLDAVNRALHISETSSRGLKRVLENVDEKNSDGIHDAIRELISGKEELATIQKEGKALMQKLESLEYNSSSNGDEEEQQELFCSSAASKQTLVDGAKPLVEERCDTFRMHKIRTDDAARLASLLRKKE